jgi:hypothetical protein
MPRYASLYLIFAGWYLAACMVVLVIVALFGFTPPGATGFIIAMAASMGMQQRFIKDNRRLMTGGEKAIFAVGGTLVAFLVSSAATVGLLAFAGGGFSMENFDVLAPLFDLGPILILFILTMVAAVTWIAVFIGLSIGAKKTLEKNWPRDG